MTRKHISTPNLASLLLSGLLPLIFLNETFSFLLWDFFRNLGTFVFKSNTALMPNSSNISQFQTIQLNYVSQRRQTGRGIWGQPRFPRDLISLFPIERVENRRGNNSVRANIFFWHCFLFPVPQRTSPKRRYFSQSGARDFS